MKASFNWICELIPGLSVTPEELGVRLTSAGLAVDGVAHYGVAAASCIVARVTAIRPHPQSAKLRLVTVDRGSGVLEEVVCGAPNVPEPGGLVVLAPLGAELPAKGLKIEARKVAGIESRGMLCSESELGLTEDSAGLLVLPDGLAAPGTTLAKALPFTRDVIYELDLTPNRPDALGHLGIARDVAALFEIDWQPPRPQLTAASDAPRIEDLARVRIDDTARCPHYGAAAVSDVRIAPSPLWLRYRLASLGVRPISNLVDITNLLMLEFGHPMHAFDLERVRGAEIIVRRAQEGEALTTLDGVARKLVSDDLLICDGQGPVALAGVMGGADSEVRDDTRRVLFECAYFEPRGVRRSARRHGMHTEASHRFERGVDPTDAEALLTRALQLTAELASGKPARGQLHAGNMRPEKRVINLPVARVSRLIGDDVPDAEIKATLTRLGCELSAGTAPNSLRVAIPTHRPDLERYEDLISEVARMRGIDRVQPVLPAIRPTRDHGPREAWSQRLRAAAVDVGLSEAITFAFVSEEELKRVHAPASTVILKNPINERHTVMRTSLLPGLLDATARARRHGTSDARLFTVGARYLFGADLPEERLSFAAVLAGTRPSYLQKPAPIDVWDAKGLAEALLSRITRKSVRVQSCVAHNRPAQLHPRGAAEVFVSDVAIGTLGPLHPDIAAAYELEPNTQVLELDVAALMDVGVSLPAFRDIPRFPASRRDLALVVSDDVPAGDLLAAIRGTAGELAEHVELFDRFVGGTIPKDHSSLAVRVVYRAPDRTLTDAEVDERHAQVVSEMHRRFAAQLRTS